MNIGPKAINNNAMKRLLLAINLADDTFAEEFGSVSFTI